MKIFVFFAVIAAVSALTDYEQYKTQKDAFLKDAGLEALASSERMACYEKKFFDERPPGLEPKIKEIMEMAAQNKERRDELYADPTKLNMDVFHEKCPMYKEKAIGVMEELDIIIKACRGDQPETERDLIFMHFVKEFFDFACSLEKEQIISFFDTRTKNYGERNAQALMNCKPKEINMQAINDNGLCGIDYKGLFGCFSDVYNSVPEGEKPLVSLSDWMLKFFGRHCDGEHSNHL